MFNIALLSRQAWRILASLDALSSRLLKQIYFSNTTILEAELGSHPSHIWRAVLEGRDALTHGITRRIGNGETTRVWDHNWIPRESSMCPPVSLAPIPPVYVNELIDSTSATW